MYRLSSIVSVAAVGLMLSMLSAPASATLLIAGSPQTFNLDFTGAPSYTAVVSQTSWTPGLIAGQAFQVQFFNDPDGVNFAAGGGASGIGATSHLTAAGTPGLNDGVFSAVISVTSGSIDITSFVVSLGNVVGQGVVPLLPPVSRTLIGASVPEPATLALLGLGLAGLGFSRRKPH